MLNQIIDTWYTVIDTDTNKPFRWKLRNGDASYTLPSTADRFAKGLNEKEGRERYIVKPEKKLERSRVKRLFLC